MNIVDDVLYQLFINKIEKVANEFKVSNIAVDVACKFVLFL